MNVYKAVEKQKKTKNVAVLFSGGLDSTYLVWKNLKEGNRVTPYYNEVLNNTSKSRIEKQQMARIIGEFRREFGDRLDSPRYAAKTELFVNKWSNTLKFKQTPIWLFSTLYMDQDFDEIQIGYVANDDSIPYIKEIKETYAALSWMLHEGQHRPELTFPIYKMPKYEMLNQLPHILKSLIYSCEAPLIMDEMEQMNEDSLTFYRGSLIEFFEKDNEDRPVFLNHEPCGECDPCRKILMYHYDHYVSNQPIYQKLKMKQTMKEFNDIIHNASYNEKTRAMYDELQMKHKFFTSFKDFSDMYKEVALLTNEVIGRDVDASFIENGMKGIEMDKVGL